MHAAAARAHNKRMASCLLGKPMLAEHLEGEMAQFDCSCEEYLV